ncbi:M55 family metallopeptidase [Paraburkholderia humisilvae]
MHLNENRWPTTLMTSAEKTFFEEYDFLEIPKGIGRVVIMADMEGVTGVPNKWAAVTPAEMTGGQRTEAYDAACRAMTLDVLMAVAGARAAGAREVVVADSHWNDTNLAEADFDCQVLRGSNAAIRAMLGADATMLIGWHARAGAGAACLPHTYTERIRRLSIDGQEVGEPGMLARLAAGRGVPVVMVAGDQAACDEISGDIGCLTTSTKSVDAAGVVRHRTRIEVMREIVGNAYTAIHGLALGTRPELPRHQPGQFEVEIHAGYEVDGDTEVERVAQSKYRIRTGSILDTYGAFQRFVERLPALT